MKFETTADKAFMYAVLALAVAALVGLDYTTIADPFRDGKMRYAMLAAVLLASRALWEMNPAWAVFAGWSACRWIFADFPSWGVIDVIMVPSCLLLGNAVRCYVKNSVAAKALAALALLQLFHMFFQVIGQDPLFNVEPAFWRVPLGTIGHPTMLGPFLAVGALYFLQRTYIMKALLLFSVLALGVIGTGSTMSCLGLGAGFLYALWRVHPGKAYVSFALALAAGSIAFLVMPKAEFFSFTGRLSVWPGALDAAVQAPLVGHGPGSWSGIFAVISKADTGMTWDQVHNDFLQLLVEQGLVGFMIVAVGLAYFFVRAQRLCPFYGSVAALLCVNALGNFPMHLACFGLIAGWLASIAHHAPPRKL